MNKMARLREMPIREIAFRLRERARIETERRFSRGSAAPRSLQTFAERFYISPAERETLPSFLRINFPEWIEKAVSEAEDLLDRPETDWHRDPATGVKWPRRFWADYDPVHDLSYGDSKSVHEINRHQHLPRLGKAFLLAGDERYAIEAVSQIESWIAQNPEGLGVNWQSSLEIAIRALSWLWTVFFVQSSTAFTDRFSRVMMQSLSAQLRHVYRYPSTYSSPNTHLIGEAAALFIGGMLLDERQWRDAGADLLAQTIRDQVLDDGVHCELSASYHCYAADFYLQALILARRNRFDLPPAVAQRVEQMLDFTMYITRPDGAMPQLGDDDGGRALALDRRHYRSYLDGLSSGAVLFARADFKWQSRALQEETFWLFGREACSLYAALPATHPANNTRAFDSAGYYVHRSGWTDRDSHAIFDCGGLGAPTGGHGHADALSLVLFSGGRELLIDPGTCVYNGAPEWRDYFRSTRAHNTVVVDQVDQSEQGGTFQWNTRARARSLPGSTAFAAGEHTGYERLASPVVHRRRVDFCPSGTCLIVDELLGSGTHTFDFLYHFPAGVDLRVTSSAGAPVDVSAKTKDAEALLFFRSTADYEAGVVGEVIAGWISARYGQRVEASVLRVRIKTTAPLTASTVILPFQKGWDLCAESAEWLTSIQATQ